MEESNEVPWFCLLASTANDFNVHRVACFLKLVYTCIYSLTKNLCDIHNHLYGELWIHMREKKSEYSEPFKGECN